MLNAGDRFLNSLELKKISGEGGGGGVGWGVYLVKTKVSSFTMFITDPHPPSLSKILSTSLKPVF